MANVESEKHDKGHERHGEAAHRHNERAGTHLGHYGADDEREHEQKRQPARQPQSVEIFFRRAEKQQYGDYAEQYQTYGHKKITSRYMVGNFSAFYTLSSGNAPRQIYFLVQFDEETLIPFISSI